MRYLSAPVEVSIELTNLCNLYCDHCYSFSGPFEFSDELTYQEITKLIDDIIEMKVFRLSLVGGEPFLRTDAVNIVGYAKGKELATVASTNGYYLDNDKLRRLHEYGIDNIQFSIDGAKAETHDKIRGTEGSFDRAVDAARRAKGFGIPITMGTTIMSSNYREMPDMLALAKDIDVDCFHVMGLQPGGRGQKDFCHKAASDDAWLEITQYTQHAIEEGKYKFPIKLQGSRFALINKGLITPSEIKQDPHSIDSLFTNCDCAKARCVIDSRGNLLGCDMLRISDKNIRTTPLSEAWHTSTVLNSMRDRDVYSIAECSDCEHSDGCRGGCAASAYNIYHTFSAADPRCGIAKRHGDEK